MTGWWLSKLCSFLHITTLWLYEIRYLQYIVTQITQRSCFFYYIREIHKPYSEFMTTVHIKLEPVTPLLQITLHKNTRLQSWTGNHHIYICNKIATFHCLHRAPKSIYFEISLSKKHENLHNMNEKGVQVHSEIYAEFCHGICRWIYRDLGIKKMILKKYGIRLWNGFIWHRMGSSGRLLTAQ